MHSNTIRSLALLAAAVATVAAQTTVSLFLPTADGPVIQAEVVGSSDSATTYLLNCAPGTPEDDCGIPTGYTVVQGPSTYQQVMTNGDDYMSIGCKLAGTTSLSCNMLRSDASSTSSDSAVVTESVADLFRPVVVTGTASAGASAATGASPTAATAAATASTTAPAKSTLATSGSAATAGANAHATGSSSASSAAASASHSPTGNAAMPQITGNAQWAIGGAAVALALAMV